MMLDADRRFYVYCWRNTVNDKRYFGKGTGNRCHDHSQHVQSGHLYSPLTHAMAKHGAEFGYNLTDGGDGPAGYRHSTATKRLLSDLNRQRKGEKRSELTRQRMRDGHARRKALTIRRAA